MNRTPYLLSFIAFAIFLVGSAVPAAAQRERLTVPEDDLIRLAQEPSERVKFFTKAIDRRLIVIEGTQELNAKQIKKDHDAWGDLPTGSRAELVDDVAGLLEELITNVDDFSERKSASKDLPKAMKLLGETAHNLAPRLEALRPSLPDGPSRESLEQAIDRTHEILEATQAAKAN